VTSAVPPPGSTPTTTSRPASPDDAALADAIAAEHATIYGYGFVSAHSTSDVNELIAESLDEHRARRDAAIAMLAARSVAPPVAAAGYQLPMTVANATDAATLALRMESDDAQAWRAVIEHAGTSQERTFGVTAVTGCAVRAAKWRQVLGAWPLTVPFPGGNEQ
jgi:Domain of unknown function (DUF4439)